MSKTVGDILNLKKLKSRLEFLLDNMYIPPSGNLSKSEQTFLILTGRYYQQFEEEIKPYLCRYMKMVKDVEDKFIEDGIDN